MASPAEEDKYSDAESSLSPGGRGGGGDAEVYYQTKLVSTLGTTTPIILQDSNGPCSLIAICNVLLLRGDIELDHSVRVVSQSDLFELIINEALNMEMDDKFKVAFSQLPKFAHGIHVNPQFQKIDDFELTDETLLFNLLDIKLYHGWIIDPEEVDTAAAIGSKSYDALTAELAISESKISGESSVWLQKERRKGDLDEEAQLNRVLSLSKTQRNSPLDFASLEYDISFSPFTTDSSISSIEDEASEEDASSENNSSCSFQTVASQIKTAQDEEPSEDTTSLEEFQPTEGKLAGELLEMSINVPILEKYDMKKTSYYETYLNEKAELIQNFLNRTASQLTDYGLKCLHDGVEEGKLCILFRNNHFSTMLKHKGEIYLLLTDQGFAQSEFVWQKLNSVDGDTVFLRELYKGKCNAQVIEEAFNNTMATVA